MTSPAIWTPEATGDLEEIIYYIAVEQNRPEVAEGVARQIREACDRHATAPLAGERETRLGHECRRFSLKRWIVLYRPYQDGIAVLRIVDGSRDFDQLFTGR